MIRPSQQWCAQIDVTNACHLHCSNCTRLLDHAPRRFVMTPDEFRVAVERLKTFPESSEPCPQSRRKVVGIIGGEPLLHPQFPELFAIMREVIPQAKYRGLWTSKDWVNDSHPKHGPYRPHVEKLLGGTVSEIKTLGGDVRGPSTRHRVGFLNWNMHTEQMKVQHQPMLVAVKDVVPDEETQWKLIRDCWVQREWSSSTTPKGFFFCEVAAAFDMVMGGPGGIKDELGETPWSGDLSFGPDNRPLGPYAEQIKRWCTGCGACVPMKARRDKEDTDDVSQSNLVQLTEIGSPRVKKGAVVVHDEAPRDESGQPWVPFKYVRGVR